MAKKQTKQDRLKRLSEGRCPIHGLTMYQIDNEQILLPCGHYKYSRAIVECSRKDCDIKAYEKKAFENAVLFPEFEYLIV